MASKRKRKEKQKDFAKAKLKVGKTAQKPDNYTDTSFKSKTISLPNQSIASSSNYGASSGASRSSLSTGPSLAVLTHQLSLTKHHSSNTRKEVLNYLQTHLPENPSYYKNIIPNIRTTSTHFLRIIVENSHGNLINSYFVKIMRNWFVLMGWSLNEQDSKQLSMAVTTLSITAMNANSKQARIGHLQNLNKFLLKTLQHDQDKDKNKDMKLNITIHPQSYKYLLTDTVQPYQPLKLFVKEFKSEGSGSNGSGISMLDLNTISTEDLDTRKKIMNDVFKPLMIKNLNTFVKEGGEIGREANNCISIVTQACTSSSE